MQRRHPTRAAEVPAVVDEPAVLPLLGGGRTDGGEQGGHGRAPPACVDDEVGAQLLPLRGAHADDVRDAGQVRSPRQQGPHRAAPADLHPRLRGRRARHDGLEHRTAGRERHETVVAVAPPPADGLGQLRHQVVPQGACGGERGGDVGQLGLQHLAEPREQVVRETELAAPAPVPALPRRGGIGRGRGVALQDGDAMPVPGEEHRGAQAVQATPDDEDVLGVGHGRLLACRADVPGSGIMMQPATVPLGAPAAGMADRRNR